MEFYYLVPNFINSSLVDLDLTGTYRNSDFTFSNIFEFKQKIFRMGLCKIKIDQKNILNINLNGISFDWYLKGKRILFLFYFIKILNFFIGLKDS